MATDISSSSTESYDSTVNAPATGDARTSASVRTPMQNIVNRARWLRARAEDRLDKFLPLGGLFPVAASVATSTFTIAGHGLNANDPVRVMSVGGSAPSPLVVDTTYYVVGGSLTSNTFQVSATVGGGAVTLTDNGSGAIYVAKRVTAKFFQVNADSLSTFSSTLHQTGGTGIIADSGVIITGSLVQGGGANTIGGDTIIGGVLTRAKAEAPASSVLNASTATQTIDASKPVWTLDTPLNSITLNVDSTTVVPVTDQEITLVVWHTDTHTAIITVQRPSGPVTICTSGTTDKLFRVQLKWSGTSWRLVSFFSGGTISNP
ncbi:MAG TPA: hypothetical protein VIU64_09045 [Polyangia bacterium]